MDNAKHPQHILLAKNGIFTDLLIITILWISAVSLVNIIGDFPLNDDWSFATTVKRLLDDGKIAPIDFTSAPIITHSLYGALFCSLFGFSFTVLRLSTIILGFLGVLGVYLLSRQLDSNRWFAVTAALTLAFNPLYFNLSHTFMTDVPFTALLVFAVFFLLRSLFFSTALDFILGAGFSIGAILDRQLGLCIPIAFVLVTLLRYRTNGKWLFLAGCLLVVEISLLIGIETWWQASGTLPALYNLNRDHLFGILEDPITALGNILYYSLVASIYLGLFLIPIAVQQLKTFNGVRIYFTIFCFMAVLSLGWLYFGGTMPLGGNVLNTWGLGPVTLRDTFVLALPHVQTIPSAVWKLVTIVSIFGAGVLLSYLILSVGNLWANAKNIGMKFSGGVDGKLASIFLLSVGAIYFLPIAVTGFFDRYLIPLVPLICGAIAPSTKVSSSSRGSLIGVGVAVSLALLLIFSVTGTRDYLTWNRARWFLLGELMTEQHIPPTEIDGGFEFNGWYLYSPDYRPEPSKSWWWVSRDTYVVSMGEIPGYDIVRRSRFYLWMPPHEGNVFVLRRRANSVKTP